MENIWKNVEIKDITDLIYGKGLSTKELTENGYPVYGANGIIGKFHSYTYEHEQIIISCRGANSGIIHKTKPKSFVTSNSIVFNIKNNKEVNLDFLKYALTSVNKESIITGTAQPQITIQLLKFLKIPLPPLPEQERIVAKLDTLFAHLETAKAGLEKIPVLLKQFRQAVLTQAVTGKLTEEWRVGKELESGTELLKRLKVNRLNIYLNECEISETKGKRKPKKPILDISINNKINFKLPEIWTFCAIGEIGEVCNGSTPSRPIKEYWNGSIPWVSSGLVQNNRITSTKEHLTEFGLQSSSVKILPKGTVLIAMIGEGKTRGQSAILDIEATINQNIAAIVIDNDFILSEYLQFWFFVNYENNRVMGNGTGPQALNCQKVRELPFNLPPINEQNEIVRRVEVLFAKADAIEEKYKQLKEKIENLPQAILAKAFRGEI